MNMALDVLNENHEKKTAQDNQQIKIGKIEVDRDLCIGAESCVVVAPDAFDMDEENIAILKDGALQTESQTLFESAQACPVAAIILYDDEGNQVYP